MCHIKRERQNKVFGGIARKGKGTMGWHFSFKLHLAVNDRGEILNFWIATGNVDDRNKDVMGHLCKGLWGKLFGDRGYISKGLAEMLYYEYGVELITKARKNMKQLPPKYEDAVLLRKRALIESVNDFLQNVSLEE
ncbi:MAG: IS982 family transposase [Eubacteriaceae bacterium]|nr:IS982 family transposase [Eubacteriaceae bacterium]